MPTTLLPLTTGELLDQTFVLYRNNFRLFFGIAAWPYAALLLCQLLLLVPAEISSRHIFSPFSGRGFPFFLGQIIVGCIAHGAITHAVSALYLGRSVTVASAYSAIQAQIGVLVVISILWAVGFIAGIILLLIPAVLLITRYSLCVPVAVVERLGVGGSFKRSNQLSKGSRRRVLLVYALFFTLSIAMSVAVSQIIRLTFGSAASAAPAAVIFRTLWNWISEVIVSPVGSTAITLLYYDQRVRKEGFDLEHMMAELTVRRATTAVST